MHKIKRNLSIILACIIILTIVLTTIYVDAGENTSKGINVSNLTTPQGVFTEIAKLIGNTVASKSMKSLFDKYWPSNQEDILEVMKKETKNIVDKSILEKELENFKSDIDGLKKTFKSYDEAANNSEKSEFLTSMITYMNNIQSKINNSSNSKQLIPLAAIFSVLHMQILRERYDEGHKYHNVNDPMWYQDIENNYKAYKEFFIKNYKDWKTWRYDQIKITKYTTSLGSPNLDRVEDTVTGEKCIFQNTASTKVGGDHATSDILEETKKRMENQANAEMAQIISGTFHLKSYLNDFYDTEVFIPELENITMGPYTPQTVGKDQNGYGLKSKPVNSVKVDDISKIDIYSYDIVDGMQFNYTNGNKSDKIGGTGGKLQTVNFNNKENFAGFNICFSDSIIRKLQIIKSTDNGINEDKDVYGKGDDFDISAFMPNDYKLAECKYATNTDSNNVKGIGGIEFNFKFTLRDLDKAKANWEAKGDPFSTEAQEKAAMETGKVILYEETNFNGNSIALDTGEYKLADLEKKGFKNDSMSSVSLPEHYSISLYEEDDFKGNSWTLGQNDRNSSNFNNFAANDKVSSIKITKN
jgi:hypothetical protein